MSSLCISAITQAELMFGLAKRPSAKRLHLAVRELLKRLDVLSWDHSISESYGIIRAKLQSRGKSLSPLDLLIAAHALTLDMVLVTSDQAFNQVAGLQVENWTE
jgi:tRNA(fMet)-specific endonuclease VapC